MFENLAIQYKSECIWDYNTLYLYFFIVLFTYVISSIRITSSKIIYSNGCLHRKYVRNYSALLISFILLFLLAAFRDVGTDLDMYRMIYENSLHDWETSAGMEPGYLLLNSIIRITGLNEFWGIGIISFIFYFFVFKTLYDNRRILNIGLSVLAFTALYYFQSFNLIRIYLASAFLLYTSKYLFKLEYKKYAICIIIAICIHYSSSVMLFPLFLLYVYNKKNDIFYPILIVSTILIFFATSVLELIPIFSRYQRYIEAGTMGNSIGFMQIAINIPIFILYFYVRNKNYKSIYLDVLWVYGLTSFIFGLLSYKILMFGRALVYFNILFMLCIPYVYNRLKKNHDKYYYLIYGCYVVYLFVRFYQYLSEYLVLDGIMPYRMIEL